MLKIIEVIWSESLDYKFRIVIRFRFVGAWEELEINKCFQRQSRAKYSIQTFDFVWNGTLWESWVPFFFNGRFFDVLWLYQKKCVNLLILAVFLRQFHLPGNEHLLEEVRWSYFVHFWTLSTMVQNISLDHIKTAITGIRKSNKRPDCNAIHQYLKNKLEINLSQRMILPTR